MWLEIVLISIIIPTCNQKKKITDVLAGLAGQAGDYEVIFVNGNIPALPQNRLEGRARLVSTPETAEGAQLMAGAAVARGEVLLFLDPSSRLPPNALQAIEQNLRLLTETIGGNFHLKFERDTLFTRVVICLLKWWRYRGSYCGNSGLFIRKNVYEAIGGFGLKATLADYDLAWRMENFGPTVFLPETIVAPVPTYRQALKWIIAPIFMKLKRN